VDCEPFLPPQKYHMTSPPEFLTLREEQDTVYQEVFKHFATEDYVIPGLTEGDGDGKLTEEEKFYLVSTFFHPFCGLLLVLKTQIASRRMNVS